MSAYMPTFDTPWLNRKSEMERVENETILAAVEQSRIAGLYMDDLEAKLAAQDELILEQSDRIIKLKGLLDGGLVELVGELVMCLNSVTELYAVTGGNINTNAFQNALSIIAKTKEGIQ